MTPLVLAAKAAVAVVLLASGGAKLADLTGFAGTIRLFVPSRALPLAQAAAVAFAVAELLTGAVSLCWPVLGWVNFVALVLSGGFAVVAAVGYARHRGRPCRCFGALSRSGFGLPGLLRALAILAVAVVACLPVRPAPQLHFALAFHLLLLAGAVLMAAAAAVAAQALLGQPDSAGTVA